MKGPIFIVGANRSGTTLLRLILNAHPHIAIPEEIVYFGSTIEGVPIEQWRAPEKAVPAFHYAGFVRRFVNNASQVLDGIDELSLVEKILSEVPVDLKRPYQTVLEQWAARHGKKRWGEKTPGNLFYADIIHQMFPHARFIHLVRDPRAGVSSMMNTPFFPKDIVFNAFSRHKFMTQGRAILEKYVPEEQRILMRYEDLVRDPEIVIRRLCDFLEEPFEPGMMTFYRESDRFMKEEAATTFNKAATKPISPDMLDKWKNKLQPSDIAQIQFICKQEMDEFGYSMEDVRLGMGDRNEIFLKWIYWKYQVWRNRHIRHFTVKSLMFARMQGRFGRMTKSVQTIE